MIDPRIRSGEVPPPLETDPDQFEVAGWILPPPPGVTDEPAENLRQV